MKTNQKTHTLSNVNLCMVFCALTLTLISCRQPSSGSSNSSDPQTPAESITPSVYSEMLYPRAGHSAVKMPDGKVFVIGGLNEPMVDETITEFYNPSTNTWSQGPNLLFADRNKWEAVLLNDGRVLVVGGDRIEVEAYDPADGLFHHLGNLSHIRSGASVTLLKNGEVLIAGGALPHSPFTKYNDAEIFSPDDNSLRPTFNNMKVLRAGHSATLRSDGTVLLAGGLTGGSVFDLDVNLFNPNSEAFVQTNNLKNGRINHYSFLLPNDHVLIVGGDTWNQSGIVTPMSWSEIYESSAFDITPDLPAARYQAATAQLDGVPLILGGDTVTNGLGLDTIFAYNFTSQEFEHIGVLSVARKSHTATVLDDGSVLVVGGWGQIEWPYEGALKHVERITLD